MNCPRLMLEALMFRVGNGGWFYWARLLWQPLLFSPATQPRCDVTFPLWGTRPKSLNVVSFGSNSRHLEPKEGLDYFTAFVYGTPCSFSWALLLHKWHSYECVPIKTALTQSINSTAIKIWNFPFHLYLPTASPYLPPSCDVPCGFGILRLDILFTVQNFFGFLGSSAQELKK